MTSAVPPMRRAAMAQIPILSVQTKISLSGRPRSERLFDQIQQATASEQAR